MFFNSKILGVNLTLIVSNLTLSWCLYNPDRVGVKVTLLKVLIF